jgi:glycosyltransferase involved in cell wall biosynthesis
MHGKPGIPRGTPEIAAALALLEDEGHAIEVICFGGMEDLEAAIGIKTAHTLTDRSRSVRFELLDYVEYADVPNILSWCHAGIVNYSGELARASLPNRLFEYMAVGLQVFASAESPHIVALLEPQNLGVIFSNGDVSSLADALNAAYRNPGEGHCMGQRAREHFISTFSWEAQMENLQKRLTH